ncbi:MULTISPECIES: methyltransferase domain-containing protein [Ramlibacter]|uniref:methyltransferase domain-containing protein n=1 Tax=Ramlibacter TaxID=174951 RepID=UPI0012FBADFB|nr:methyltransferase domain-containing protein [Ramlibacter sp. CGMCC 1.13660]
MSAPSSARLEFLATRLRVGEHGIWSAGEQAQVSYPADGHASCFAVEDGSFWFQHRNRCIEALVVAQPPADRGLLVDVGGGNGVVAKGLQDAGFEVALIEPAWTGALNARRRGLRQVACSTLQAAGFRPGTVPAAGLFDVLEHIEDDVAFLSDLRFVLTPAGRLYLTVPAYRGLWSEADVDAGHMRRYDLREVCDVLRRAGFRIDYASYFFRPLPLPVLLLRTLPYRLGLRRPADSGQVHSDHAARRGGLSSVAQWLLRTEIDHIGHGRSMRFGGSCIVAASVV